MKTKTPTPTERIPLNVNYAEIEKSREKLKKAAASFFPLLTFLRQIEIEPTPDEFREAVCSSPEGLHNFIKRKAAAKHPVLATLPTAMQLQGAEVPDNIIREATEILKGIQQRSGRYALSLVYSLTFAKNSDMIITPAAEAQLLNLNTTWGTSTQHEAMKDAEHILELILNWNEKYDSTLIQSLPGSILHIQNNAPSFVNIRNLLSSVTINY